MLKILGIVLGVVFLLGLAVRVLDPQRAVRQPVKLTPKEEAAVARSAAALHSKLPDVAPVKDDLEMLAGVKGSADGQTMVIAGRVRNNRAKPYRYAQITFQVYNKADEQIGTALANIAGLEAGGTWRFEARCFCKGGSTFKLAGVTGY